MSDERTNESFDFTSPIIIVGMHRSGTSIVAKLVSRLGVDMGRFQDVNHEPRAYIAINNWILQQSGTTWQYPESFKRLSSNTQAFEVVVETIRLASNRSVMRFMHRARFMKRSVSLWGWKDPRTTITLPVWSQIYPNAKYIYVYRHGVPVASSLVVRKRKVNISDLKWWHRFLAPIKPGPGLGSRLWNMQDGLALWDEYCDAAERNLSVIDSDKVLKICYEDLLSQPVQITNNIARFIGVDASTKCQADAKIMVSSRDPYDFRSENLLSQLELDNADLLKKHGYSNENEKNNRIS